VRLFVSAADPYLFPEVSTSIGGNRTFAGKATRDPRLNAGETTGVFVIAGQSNSCNVAPSAYTPSNASKIDNISVYDGGTREATDPLLGCEDIIVPGSGPGNLFLRMADKLITAGTYQRVILMPVGTGGTTIAQWNSTLYHRLIVAGRRLSSVGLSITAYLWMQGENDNTAGTSQATYASGLSTLIGTPRAEGFNAPWLIGKCTYIGGTVSAGVQAAQVAAANGVDIFAGADTDTLTGTATNRIADDTHLTSAGQDSAAALWRDAIVAAI
jgi:hypothetical protein